MDRGLIPGLVQAIFLSTQTPTLALEPHSTFCSVGTRTHSLRVKRPGREPDNRLLLSAEVKNDWSYTTAPSIHLYSAHSDNFTFGLAQIIY
jgi:hypothetical protein